MSSHPRLVRVSIFAATAFVMCLAGVTAPAQIKTEIVEKYRAELRKQAAEPEMKRERGTQPQDWIFALPEGVRSRQITFYSDGAPCYGRIFFPKGFNARGKWPAVVVGHGINAQAVGIEKYAARFAERGLVAMAIDYRTYGYSVDGERYSVTIVAGEMSALNRSCCSNRTRPPTNARYGRRNRASRSSGLT